jgi:hypothetical protein
MVERLPGRLKLTSGCEDRDARTNGASNLGDPDSSERSNVCRAETRARACDDIAFSNVTASGSDVLTRGRRLGDLDAIAVIHDPLDGDNGVSAVRHRSASCYPGC